MHPVRVGDLHRLFDRLFGRRFGRLFGRLFGHHHLRIRTLIDEAGCLLHAATLTIKSRKV
jgi:hypothetical protein